MAEQIQEVFWLTSADRQQLLYVSQAFEAIWGRPVESLYAYPGGHVNLILDSIHPSDRDQVVAAANNFQSEYKQEYRIVRPNGSIRWVRSRFFPVQNPFGETWGIAGLSEDITERKQAEDILHQREQEFRALVELSPDIISRFDRELRHIYVNPAIKLATGMLPQEFLGKTNRELAMPQAVLSSWEQSLQKVFQTGETDENEFSFLTPTGLKYYQSRLVPELAADGSVEFVLGICRDLTKNKQTEEALRESEERFRTVFESAPMGMVLANPKGMFLQTNQAFQEIFGYSETELQNLSFIDLTHPADRAENVKVFQELFLGKRTHFSLEKRCFRKDGSLVWVNVSVSAVGDANGLPQYAIGIIQDISDVYSELRLRKQAELALQQAHDELEKRVAERTAELAKANTLLQQEIAERKQAQEALKEQKEFLRAILDTNPNAIFVKDTEGKFLLVNQQYADFRGLTVEDLLGLTDAECNPNQAEVDQFLCEDQEVNTTLQQIFIPEEACRFPTGEVRWFQIIKKPIFSSDGQVGQVLGVCTDITERKLAEQQRRESEEQLRLALEAARIGFWDWNLQTGKITWSNNFKQLFGWSSTPEEGTYKSFLEIVHPEDRDRLHSCTQCCIATGENCDLEFRIIWPDGSIHWIESKGQVFYDVTGKPVRTTGINLDITERKQAEELQRQTQARLRRLVEANLIGVIFADFSGNITEANDTFLNMVGYTREDLRAGKVRWLDMTPPEYAEDDAQARAQIRLTGVCTPHEKEYIRKDGSRVPILTGSALLEGSEQDCVSFVVDLTWHKHAETQIQASLREKEVLLQEIHHRVKNNLQVICSLLDLQSQDIEELATLEMFRESQNRVKSMALVHERLYQSKDFASINFAEYIENLISYLFQVYRMNASNITLELDIDEVSLNIDQAIPCGLIISELVSNALKYAFPNSQKGTITINLHLNLNNQITLIIKDNGVGFNTNFDFSSLNSLGLKLVNILIHQLEGTLEVAYSAGTEFKINFLGHIC